MKFICLCIVALLALCQNVTGQDYTGQALLIVYPDYPIDTDTFYGYTKHAGHAGVLLINKLGVTKYYEFGRYDPQKNGLVKTRTIPNVTMERGKVSDQSLKKVLETLSTVSGRGGRIRAARFMNMDFDAMNAWAKNPGARKYSIQSYNCGHFAEAVIHQGNPRVDKPTIINFTPNNIVDEYIEEGNAEILFNPKDRSLKTGQGNESDAKNTN